MALRVNMLIGCTASGKSRVALEAAQMLNGEIVSIDSMKVYRRMDIGTAKPDAAACDRVPHHLIDVVEPWESFSLGRFTELADAAFKEITSRDKPIIAAGGTMLYVQGLTAGVFEGPSADPAFRKAFRERVATEGAGPLHEELKQVDPESANKIHPNDSRRVERALEVFHTTGKPISELQTQWNAMESQYDCRVIGLRREKDSANRRINARVKRMIEEGLVDEVKALVADERGLSREAAQAVGYAEMIDHLNGKMKLDDTIEQIKINSRRLGKHQRTWMRRMPNITYIDMNDDSDPVDIARQACEIWASA